MDFTLLSTLAVIHSLALISPGPDFAIIVKTATQQTRSTAIMCAVGISAAILVHSLLSLLGISIMIQQSAMAYIVVQIIGVSYLAWMGYGALAASYRAYTQTQASSDETEINGRLPHQGTMSALKGFQIGLYTNLLNPKALIFFITIFTVLVTPQVTIETKFASASLLFGLSIIWFCFLAIILTNPNIQHKMAKGNNIINIITGIIFLGVAITIAMSLISTHLLN
ncbi:MULTISPECIES: LysE family transporter [unclassified Shewanella]|uniref:LysE family transporter n=1 Tax=unclassified Shewanella TaxID=196818 RepID=UPI000C81ED4B|nr:MULTISPECIES: LysE family transporter [unclassified Shewanella]MDO6621041.1 LysE family transporter [Shewanella sp. 6_MG-2023]MDO6641741.1 LysE family transporter [Shewanella sp. 5_MG-2023]MDO6776918.1 LysE family transporter [Shewanella sp. 3_MG-2023]PMG29921.1 lysine transporter LysE [Shewanella sp. 10N.286.52.C2]PMG42572.1 lysine transporter LysE [Shewanella sp. 10N.286.52.B9]